MDDKTSQSVVIDDIADVSADVRAIKRDTRDTGRDVSSLKDDVGYIQDQLSQIQKSTKTTPVAKKQGAKRTVYTTKAGASTLTGVSLNEMALRIKAQSPGKSYAEARKQAKDLQSARDTLETGGGSVLGNLKSGILRNTLGENLGGKVSRFLTSDKAKEKAASTLVNFDATKSERLQQAEPVAALAEQVSKLSDAVKQNTAVKVEPPQVVPKALKEDLSDAVAALKVLGYDMKEIKERLSTLPRGLTTEQQVKHALKSSSERIEARHAYEATVKAIQENTPAPTPVQTPAFTPDITPKAGEQPRTFAAVRSTRGVIPADQLSQRKKQDAQNQENKEAQQDEVSWQDKVLNELHGIKDGIKHAGSESFIALVVAALLAAVMPYLGPIKTAITAVWDVVKTIFTSIEKFSDWATSHILDIADRLTPSDKTKNTLGGIAENIGYGLGKTAAYLGGETQDVQDEIAANQAKDEQKRANKAQWYEKGYTDSMIETLPKSVDEAEKRKMSVWVDDQYKRHDLIQRTATPVAPPVPTTADKMDKQSTENSTLKDNRTSMVIAPIIQPIKETQVPVPSGGGGDQSILALLDARNGEQSAGGYMGTIFDHPAAYGAISRV